jgi:hypothetical protein
MVDLMSLDPNQENMGALAGFPVGHDPGRGEVIHQAVERGNQLRQLVFHGRAAFLRKLLTIPASDRVEIPRITKREEMVKQHFRLRPMLSIPF